jgi:hypothetical protein
MKPLLPATANMGSKLGSIFIPQYAATNSTKPLLLDLRLGSLICLSPVKLEFQNLLLYSLLESSSNFPGFRAKVKKSVMFSWIIGRSSRAFFRSASLDSITDLLLLYRDSNYLQASPSIAAMINTSTTNWPPHAHALLPILLRADVLLFDDSKFLSSLSSYFRSEQKFKPCCIVCLGPSASLPSINGFVNYRW